MTARIRCTMCSSSSSQQTQQPPSCAPRWAAAESSSRCRWPRPPPSLPSAWARCHRLPQPPLHGRRSSKRQSQQQQLVRRRWPKRAGRRRQEGAAGGWSMRQQHVVALVLPAAAAGACRVPLHRRLAHPGRGTRRPWRPGTSCLAPASRSWPARPGTARGSAGGQGTRRRGGCGGHATRAYFPRTWPVQLSRQVQVQPRDPARRRAPSSGG